jgi:hypothetical protein
MNLNKPKILILALLLSGSCGVMYSQGDTLKKADSCLNNILETKVLRKGFYRTMNEFQTNSPSFKPNFSTFKYDQSAEYYLTTKRNMLVLIDRKGKKTYLEDPIWGFCDGEKVYFKDAVSEFNDIILIGHYCIFSKSLFGSNGYYDPGKYGDCFSYLPDFTLNILTRQTMELTVANIKKFILVDDPELLEQFNKENMQKSVMFQYIKKYNERHPLSF